MNIYKVQVSEDKTEWLDYETGKYHREDGPAIEWASGTKFGIIMGNAIEKMVQQ